MGSAIGFLVSPVSYTTRRTHYMRLADLDLATVRRLLEEMHADAEQQVRSAAAHGELTEEWKTFMRYVGQGHDIAIRLDGTPGRSPRPASPPNSSAASKRNIVASSVARSTATPSRSSAGPTSAPSCAAMPRPSGPPSLQAARPPRRRHALFDPVSGKTVSALVVDRQGMTGSPRPGPVLIVEAQTTIVVSDGFEASRDDSGCILVGQRLKRAAQPSGQGTLANQIMWNRLLSVVEEQAQALIRTSFSSVAGEAGDLSAGMFTPDGRMIAQAVTGMPGHVNSMAQSVFHFLKAIPLEQWHEGDVGITNDPVERGPPQRLLRGRRPSRWPHHRLLRLHHPHHGCRRPGRRVRGAASGEEGYASRS